MTNLIVSNTCNLNCAYCFARDSLQASLESYASHFISLDAFSDRLAFLERSDVGEIRLLGGEPTLHPKFPELVAMAMTQRKPVVIFSHGLLSEQALACLEVLPVEQCTVLVNMNATHGAEFAKREQNKRRDVLRRLGPRAMLGFNIFKASFDLNFLLPLILDVNCRPSIRLGLAHPALFGRNEHLHPKQYPIVGHQIANFANVAAKAGVRLEFDCGFVRCMFSNSDFEILHQTHADIGWRCNPILDIDLDGHVYHCFPLASKVQRYLSKSCIAADLRESMLEQTQLHRQAGIYRECSTCLLKQNAECMGGCLAHAMMRFQPAGIHIGVPKNILN